MHKIIKEKQSSLIVEVNKKEFQNIWLNQLDQVDESSNDYEINFGEEGVDASEVLDYL